MALEDFTTYDEVDSDGDLTVAENTITIVTMRQDAVSWVSEDKGANHFGDFEHLIDTKITGITNGFTIYWGISDGAATYGDMDTANEGMAAYINVYATDIKIRIADFTNSNNDFYTGAKDTAYYYKIERNGTTLTNKIYSDSARTVLVDTLTITCTNTTYSDIIVCGSLDLGAAPTCDGTINDLDLQEEETHDPTDDANASDSVTFNAGKNLTDDANASDANTFNAGVHLADTAKAGDSVGYNAQPATIEDTAKASDSISFQMCHAHLVEDTAKASDALTFEAEINLADIAKASDLYSDNSPPPPVVEYPCPTFTLYGTSTNILFPKPEWANPNNSISKNVSLFNFKSGDLDTVDRGINAQPLTIGGTVFIYDGVANWCDNATMTIWLDSIKTAMNNGETFTINELGDCLNGVYVIGNFTFNTIKGVPDAFTWTLSLERVIDV